MSQLAVVIPTHHRAELLRRVLDGLSRQRDAVGLAEVIVVADGADPAAAEVAASFAGRLAVRYLEQPKRGVSAARNAGVSATRADVVLLLDDDVIPSPALIAEHMRFHQQRPEKTAGLLGYVTWHSSLHVTPFMRWYGEYGALFAYALLSDGAEADPRYFYSCNVSIKRSLFLEQGGFNEALTVMEDNEFGSRLHKAGMSLVFQRAARGEHYQTFTFRQACARLERYSSGLQAFLRTDAGRKVKKRRRSLAFRIAELAVRTSGPLLRPLLRVVDSETALPNALYRTMYWYYGSYLSFWSRAK